MKKISVYENFSFSNPIKVGELFIENIRGKESFSFEYDETYLNRDRFIMLDPELFPLLGRQYPRNNRLFGVFQDCKPDRWGENLLKRKENIEARIEERKPKKLFEIDYLLGVEDETRQGALRFSIDDGVSFLNNDKAFKVPPVEQIRTLEEAARHLEDVEDISIDRWLDILLKPGSSLGGARPKATVQDVDGSLWIAKFPSKHDENNSGAWEMVAHELALLCDINVPEAKLLNGNTFLVKRFDREKDRRIHFASAMTMLDKEDGEEASYLEIAEFLKTNSYKPKSDLLELWKRMVFNMAVSNTDDHLRNHGFILNKKGWELAPAYDINPVPYGDRLALNIIDDNLMSIDDAIKSAKYYNIGEVDADKISKDIIKTVVANWEKLANKYGISKGQIESMRPAFNLCIEIFGI